MFVNIINTLATLAKLLNVTFPFWSNIDYVYQALTRWAPKKDKSHYDLMEWRFGSEFMNIVVIRHIDAADVCRSVSLVT